MEFYKIINYFTYFMGIIGYNIDIFSPSSIYKGPDGSYLGFSMSVHRTTGYAWLMTGAPRSFSIYQQSLERPGAIYMCSLDIVREISLGNHTLGCEQLPLDRKGNVDINETKDLQWLGASVSSAANIGSFSILVACGHLWRYDHRIGGYKFDTVNGACYIKRGDPIRGVTYVNRDATYFRSITGKNQTEVGKSSKLMGLSTHVAKDGIIYSGTPGSGLKVDDTANGGINKYNPFKNESCDLKEVTFSVDSLSYLGFTITTGNILAKSKSKYNLIAGAPLANNVGQVLVFSERDCTGKLLQRITGNQLKSYFGGALLVSDVNGDGWDDLFIGSPFFKTRSGDEGIVKVYYGGQNDLLEEALTISSNKPGSRFGITISSAGDLDEDGYNDIIIGSPYEDSGRGAVYVYNGSPHGLSESFTQRIGGSDLQDNPMGLGYGVTGGFDVDRNGYNDVAMGAYGSDHVYVIRTRPVLNIIAETVLQEKCITPEQYTCPTRSGALVPCFSFNFTITWDSMKPEALAASHVLNWGLEMDSYEALNHRALFLVNDSSIRKREGFERLQRNKLAIHSFNMQIPKNPIDRIRPILLNIQYFLDAPNITYPENPNKLPPIVNHTLGGTIETKIEFCKDCSGDLTCQTDLRIQFTPGAPYYVIGQSKQSPLELKILITNDGDGAYNSELRLYFPKGTWVSFRSTDGRLSCVRTSIEEDHSGMEAFICPTGNPMAPNTTRSVFFFVTSSQKDDSGILSFTASVKTLTTETPQQLLNNNATLHIPVRYDAELQTKGTSSPPSLVAIESRSSTLSYTSQFAKHVLDIRNTGPGLITNFTVNIDVPLVFRDDIVVLVSDFDISYEGNKDTMIGCVSPTIYNITYTENSRNIIKDLSSLFGTSDTIALDPNVMASTVTNCTIEGLQVDERVIITYNIEVQLSQNTTGNFFSSGSRYEFSTRVTLPKFFGERSIGQSHNVKISTAILPPKADSTIPWWVILASALGGLLLFIILIVVLAKLGFFRRKKQESLKQERAKSMLLEAPDDDDESTHTLKNSNPQTPEEEKLAMQNYVKSALNSQ